VPRKATIDAAIALLCRGMQRCPGCKLELPLVCFSASASSRSGRNALCKTCDRAKQATRRLRVREMRARVLAEIRSRPRPVELPGCCEGTWTPDGWRHDPSCVLRPARQLAAARNGL
jgi:hypothetical protein